VLEIFKSRVERRGFFYEIYITTMISCDICKQRGLAAIAIEMCKNKMGS